MGPRNSRAPAAGKDRGGQGRGGEGGCPGTSGPAGQPPEGAHLTTGDKERKEAGQSHHRPCGRFRCYLVGHQEWHVLSDILGKVTGKDTHK